MKWNNHDQSQTWYVGMDIGGTSIKLCASKQFQQIEHKCTLPSAELGAVEVLSQCIVQITEWAEIYGSMPSALGVGFPGIISESGNVIGAPNLPQWVGLPLKQWLSQTLHIPVALANDANAAALAEAEYLHQHQGYRNVVFLTLGTGVGAGIILDGKIFHGAKGFSAEAGHLTVEPQGFLCGCGRRGCLEQYFSSKGILQIAREEFGTLDQSVKQIFKKAALGSPTEQAILLRACDCLAIGVSNICTLLDPDCIVLGGGISKDGDQLLDLLEIALRPRLKYPGYTLPDLRISHYHEQAGSYGCLLLASQVVSELS